MKYRLIRPDTRPREQSPIEKRAWAVATELGFTDEERYELARMVIGVDPDGSGSWTELDDRQFSDLCTMLEGYVFVSKIMMDRG